MLRAATELAYIVEVPRLSATPCVDMLRLIARVPWLAADSVRVRALFPLVEGPSSVFVRRSGVAVALDWEGTPLLVGANGMRR